MNTENIFRSISVLGVSIALTFSGLGAAQADSQVASGTASVEVNQSITLGALTTGCTSNCEWTHSGSTGLSLGTAAGSNITVSAALAGPYTLTVTGTKDGKASHTYVTTWTITVTPAPVIDTPVTSTAPVLTAQGTVPAAITITGWVQRSKGEKSYKGTLDDRRASAVAKFLKANGLNLKMNKAGKDIKGDTPMARSVTVALTDVDGVVLQTITVYFQSGKAVLTAKTKKQLKAFANSVK